ncbi:hypothetical protein Tsubulata_020130 [Turnera subulata]|uniref:Peptidase A1 domain-containing protein n=1 Tax=Turnera subulata TaxID=218843 RepID=A0A9Q0G4D3_9ROSI|nr:hypothetical protein Tsubulata_020130 [Turnera subulata]
MGSVPSLLLYFFLSLLFPFTTSITIPLRPTNQNPPPQDPYQRLNHLVSTSLTRAHHLRNPRPTTTTTTPLFSRSYGGYSISLSFGTPPQSHLSFVMDTGSDFVWFPCTNHYLCKSCPFSPTSSKIQSFLPKLSSSSKIIGCKNPKCSWVHHEQVNCQECNNNASKNCTQICPPYLILYGSGTTGGIAISETLHLHDLTVQNFLAGCSVVSSHQPSGIAGFGRGPASLPSQLNLTKFSYCLISHKFDDVAGKSSSMILHSDHSGSDKKTAGLQYTPFVNVKPEDDDGDNHPFSVYYYLSLRRISVGGNRVKIPYKYLSPGSDGNGGTIIDSGTTFTFMAREVFEALSNEFIAQVKGYKRAVQVEALTGLRPCFNVSSSTSSPGGGDGALSFPELRLHFKGGAEVALPVENYFAFVDDGVACLTVVTDGPAGPEREAASGPGIILGNFQMQNFYVEYDLRNERLGFKKQKC